MSYKDVKSENTIKKGFPCEILKLAAILENGTDFPNLENIFKSYKNVT